MGLCRKNPTDKKIAAIFLRQYMELKVDFGFTSSFYPLDSLIDIPTTSH